RPSAVEIHGPISIPRDGPQSRPIADRLRKAGACALPIPYPIRTAITSAIRELISTLRLRHLAPAFLKADNQTHVNHTYDALLGYGRPPAPSRHPSFRKRSPADVVAIGDHRLDADSQPEIALVRIAVRLGERPGQSHGGRKGDNRPGDRSR